LHYNASMVDPHDREPDTEGLPAQIGKYKVRSRIGHGATSEVFLAHDAFMGVDVAVKRLRRGVLGTAREANVQQHFFAAEAALVGRLLHPNIVRIYDAVADGDPPYVVMEYVPGGTLRRFCEPDALLPLEQAIEVGFKCAMALDYVYRQGVIHRDVKPANILTRMEGDRLVDVKITDFGSALHHANDLTQIYRVGSLAYMSPEQLDGDKLDCRADIYALAAMLYHLIAGRPPFEGQQQQVVMNQIFHVTPRPLRGLRDGVSARLDELILAAMAKSRDERPANWVEFAGRLSAVVADPQLPRSTQQAVFDSERFNLLRGLDFFTGFGDVELWEVVHRATWQRFDAGHVIYRKDEEGDTFHILARGELEVWRDGERIASLSAGSSVGEMAYLAPNSELKRHSVDVRVSQPATTVAFAPQAIGQLSMATQHLFDKAFNRVLVRRLHAAHEALYHPRRVM
jgi:tRNA A-37 threonylcarbamoyl transferase component Bud32